MVLDSDQRSSALLLDDDQPPFLSEATTAVRSRRPSGQPVDKVVDFAYKWRVALALSLVPVLLGAFALTLEPSPPHDPVLTGEEASPLEALRQTLGQPSPPTVGVDTNSPVAPVQPNNHDLRTAPTAPAEEAASGPAGPPATPTPRQAPATTTTEATTSSESTTTTEETTTSASTTTTEAVTTTEAPTTDPGPCTIRVRRRTNLFDEPGGDRIGRARRGEYRALDVSGEWYRIEAQGDLGWVRGGNVSVVSGNC